MCPLFQMITTISMSHDLIVVITKYFKTCTCCTIKLNCITKLIFLFNQEEMKDGKWVFTCQHGPAECVGNLIEVRL